jgi:hypothetical protein
MAAARAAAQIQGDPKDDKRKQNQREVREVHLKMFIQYGLLHPLPQE